MTGVNEKAVAEYQSQQLHTFLLALSAANCGVTGPSPNKCPPLGLFPSDVVWLNVTSIRSGFSVVLEQSLLCRAESWDVSAVFIRVSGPSADTCRKWLRLWRSDHRSVPWCWSGDRKMGFNLRLLLSGWKCLANLFYFYILSPCPSCPFFQLCPFFISCHHFKQSVPSLFVSPLFISPSKLSPSIFSLFRPNPFPPSVG